MTAKLLLDQNLSVRLLASLETKFPGSNHVRLLELDRSPDRDIWTFAGEHRFTIVSKDSDFHHLSTLFGPPPKVVWLRAGNCSTGTIQAMLVSHMVAIQNFCADAEGAFLVLD